MRVLLVSGPPQMLRGWRTLLPLALSAAGALALLGAVSMFVQEPARARLEAAQQSYEAARQTHLRMKNARHSLETVQGVWRRLPARDEFASVVLAVSESAHRDRVAIPGMTYSFQRSEEDRALQVSMTFRAAGPYDAIRRFIHRLETTDWFLVVESLDVARSNKPDLVELNVRVVTFLKPSLPTSGNHT